MLDLIKKLYERRTRRITIMLLDDSRPNEDNSYKLKPNNLFGMLLALSGALMLLAAVIFMVTPLGSLLYNPDKASIREQIIDITERTIALEDSLLKRDRQLEEMKDIIRLSTDTTLNIDERFADVINEGLLSQRSAYGELPEATSMRQLNQTQIISAGVLREAPVFPARFPVPGTVTRGYIPENSHFGIDIAAGKDETVLNVAEGSVTGSSWTIKYGYVLSVQHSNGIITVYKHLSSVNKKEGDLVLKGDILGTVGDSGILSSGPHLHFEIWKNGVPQNPELYLVK